MATARKRWFRVADSVGSEPWSNDVLATLIRLQAHLNTRWARDGKQGADASSAVLRRVDVMTLTGRTQFARAMRVMRECSACVSLTVCERDGNVMVSWPKFAEFQRYESEPGAELGTDGLDRVPPPRPASRVPRPAPAKEEERSPSDSEPADAVSRPPWLRMLNLLSKEPGSLEEKRAWFEANWALIESRSKKEASRGLCTESSALRDWTLRFWHYQRHGPKNGRDAPDAMDRWLKEREQARGHA